MELLKNKGYIIEEKLLNTPNRMTEFRENGWSTVPQVVINGEYVGNFEDTERYLGYEQQTLV
jgi:glutaredoxin|tara:strand:+ start:995 stop:1180 length:186 start_codon:yes stop_codon:yes gene_type:complete